MADKKISELTPLTGADLADNDEFAVVDTSATETKAITFGELKTALDTSTGFVRITGDTMTGGLTVPTVDINGGTIDGTVIGGSTPAAISGTTITATGDVDIADKIVHTGDTNTSIRFPAADTVTVETAGTERVRVDSSGNVGIGTSSPAGKLDVVGAIRLTNTANSANFGTLSDGGGLVITSGNNNPMYFNTGGSERMRIDSSGNVGIGTTAPLDLLHIKEGNGTATSTQLMLHNNNSGSGSAGIAFSVMSDAESTAYTPKGAILFERTATNGRGAFKFMSDNVDDTNPFSSGDEVMRIDPAGNVGIGTSSPASFGKLAVVSGTTNGSALTAVSSSTGATDYAKITFFHPGNDTFSLEGGFVGLLFKQSGTTERMRIDASGNLLVGTTSSTPIQASRSVVMSIPGNGDIAVNHSTANDPGDVFMRFGYNGSQIGSITQSGTTGVAYNTSSDYRLKENVVPLAGAADRLAQIPVHQFNFIADPDTIVDGFLAHEVQAFVPEAVTGQKDQVDKDGKPQYQGIDQSKVVPLLTAALQEALTEIADLKARVAALEA